MLRMAERKPLNEGHATFVNSQIQRIEKAAEFQIRRIEKASAASVKKAEDLAPREQMEELLQKTERMADRLGDFVIFRKIRHMGKQSKRFFVLVVASAVILYWRGLWDLYDLFWEYALPHNRVTAAFISILVGAVVLVGTGKLIDALGPVEVDIEENVYVDSEKPPHAAAVNPSVRRPAETVKP